MNKEKVIREILEQKDLREIWLFVDDILESGLTIEEIINYGEPYDGYFVDQYEAILELGADPMKLFRLNEKWYKVMMGRSKEVAQIISVYVKYGLDLSFATEWIKKNIPGRDIVKYADSFRIFNIHPEEYKQAYLYYRPFLAVWDDIVYGDVPSLITPNDIICYYSIKNIYMECILTNEIAYSGFERFVKEFAKLGGDLNLLASKFLDAYGYPEDDGKLMALASLAKYGATNVDANKIIDSLTYKAYTYKDKFSKQAVNECIREMLDGIADRPHLNKLK